MLTTEPDGSKERCGRMSRPESVGDGVAIVLLGAFNPAILSPAWLLSQGLIGAAEYSEADVEIITRDISIFRTGWLICNVIPDRLQLTTSQMDESERLRDAAIGVLRVLSHTPVASLGINREIHFPVGSAEQWHRIGDALAPKAVWEDVVKFPGTRSIVIWGARPDRYGGRIQVTLEPSLRAENAIYIQQNDHFNLTIPDSEPTSRDEFLRSTSMVSDGTPAADKLPIAIDVLSEEFKNSLARADKVASRIWKLGEGSDGT